MYDNPFCDAMQCDAMRCDAMRRLFCDLQIYNHSTFVQYLHWFRLFGRIQSRVSDRLTSIDHSTGTHVLSLAAVLIITRPTYIAQRPRIFLLMDPVSQKIPALPLELSEDAWLTLHRPACLDGHKGGCQTLCGVTTRAGIFQRIQSTVFPEWQCLENR